MIPWAQLAKCSLLEYSGFYLCTGREYTQCHVWSKRTQWSEIHIHLCPGKFGDVIADGVSLARVDSQRQHSFSGRTLNSHSTSGQGRGQQSTSLAIRKADGQGERERKGGNRVFTEYSVTQFLWWTFILRSSQPWML